MHLKESAENQALRSKLYIGDITDLFPPVSQIITPDDQPLKRVSDVLKDGQEIDV